MCPVTFVCTSSLRHASVQKRRDYLSKSVFCSLPATLFAVRFTQGKPFRPYEQLLSVLPAASAPLLPPAYQRFMLNPDSPILDFYPTEFEVDMEGKRASWEGVVKVPFVDEVGVSWRAACHYEAMQ